LAAPFAYANKQLNYSGTFTNTTRNARGTVILHLTVDTSNVASGYINFTEFPGGIPLCGAGDFYGVKEGDSIDVTFKSKDPDRGCGFMSGMRFKVNATLSEDSRTIEGNYYVNNDQGTFGVMMEK
jgi:hypothetical protein